VRLPFVHAEPERAGFPDRLAVDGPRVPFDAAEELLVRLPEAKEDVAAVGAADDGRVVGGGFARASTFEGAGGASEAVGRQGRRMGTEDQDGAWFGLRDEGRRGENILSPRFSPDCATSFTPFSDRSGSRRNSRSGEVPAIETGPSSKARAFSTVSRTKAAWRAAAL
jgi:hypothetical protein